MMTLVFFLEEPSAREVLEGILPRLITTKEIQFHYVVFQGKQDLEKQLERKLRWWLKPRSQFIVLRDQDSGDCHTTKERLQEICRKARKPGTLIRIACRELESWYLGDLAAVEAGLAVRGLAGKQNNRKYRNPDRLNNAAPELRRITAGKYQKLSGSRALGPVLNLTSNRSPSFRVFLAGIKQIVTDIEGS